MTRIAINKLQSNSVTPDETTIDYFTQHKL